MQKNDDKYPILTGFDNLGSVMSIDSLKKTKNDLRQLRRQPVLIKTPEETIEYLNNRTMRWKPEIAAANAKEIEKARLT